ncbi:MAG: lysophospholipid acyltransferase family protein [Planctomycetota bacterium]
MSRAEELQEDPRGGASLPLWLALRGLAWVACVLPPQLVYAAATPLGAGLYLLLRWREPRANRRRRGVLRNLRIAFQDELDDAGRRRLCWRYARHAALLALEVLRLPLLTRRRAARRVDLRELRPVLELAAGGRGLIVATGHFGNWEALAYVGGRLLPLTSLVRPCPEPGLQRFLMAHRQRSGQRVRGKFGGLWPLRKALQRGETIGLNVDENMRHGGLFVPFCGVLASTNPSAALLQRVSKAPIAVLTCPRTGPERYRVRVWDVIHPAPGPAEEERARVTARIAAGFERALRADPEQWLWSLRRWETRPEGEPERPDGLPQRV